MQRGWAHERCCSGGRERGLIRIGTRGDTCMALEPKVCRCGVSIAEAVVLPSESVWGVTQTSACRRGGVGGVTEAHLLFAARAAC